MSAKKLTIQIDEELLNQAQKSTNAGITETIRRGLKLLAAQESYKEALSLQGQFKFNINVDKLRKDS